MGGGGKNCCIPGCVNFYTKTKGAGVSYVRFPKKEVDAEWRGKLIAAVARGDATFNADKHHICTVHFEPASLLFHGKGYKLVRGALPTLFMPTRSIVTPVSKPRKSPCPRLPPPVPLRIAYKSTCELIKDAHSQPLPWVVLHEAPCDDECVLVMGLVESNTDVNKRVYISADFLATISYMGACFGTRRNIESSGLRALLKSVVCSHWCSGSNPRSATCAVMIDYAGMCQACTSAMQRQQEKALLPLKETQPLSTAPVPALIGEVRAMRSRLKDKQGELEAVQRKLAAESVVIDDMLKEGFKQILDEANISDCDPFIKLFWEEQKKALTRDPRGMRWHPMMIRFAIYLHYQSPRAYEALRNTGVLQLPNKATLRDYSNVLQPREGFQSQVLQEIGSAVEGLPENKRYAALLHDEMTIRGDLVYDHRGGELVGFVNPQAWTFHENNGPELACQMLVFMAVGINNNIKKVVSYFATCTATADILFPLLWETVSVLELRGLKIITCTSDKASQNQRLYRMHGAGEIVHQTLNVYAEEDDRPLFFISDAPHLIKTIRNNLENSRPGGTRCLWNNEQHMWWNQIFAVYEHDLAHQLRRTKLRDEHVRLTPSSRMSVRLAAQVFSRSVSLVLQEYHGRNVQELSAFILKVDQFFDCLNGRSLSEHLVRRKPELAPYRDAQDIRFQFLNDFEQYIQDWKMRVDNRAGFSKQEKARMFLSRQTYEGILTTVRGFVGAVQFLLNHDVPYVLANTFCQDPLEEHFGRHRGIGQRSRNPSVAEFRYQENRLNIQRTLAFQFQPRGNVQGGGHPPVVVDAEPLPKIRRQ